MILRPNENDPKLHRILDNNQLRVGINSISVYSEFEFFHSASQLILSYQLSFKIEQFSVQTVQDEPPLLE